MTNKNTVMMVNQYKYQLYYG